MQHARRHQTFADHEVLPPFYASHMPSCCPSASKIKPQISLASPGGLEPCTCQVLPQKPTCAASSASTMSGLSWLVTTRGGGAPPALRSSISSSSSSTLCEKV